ncbi:methyl-CpG-binding domain protein 1 isoform X13 [Peromyscus maniculatus bairdii]|uniref:methyl-CpG-binding domain protein 1 isoform X13 n=1 Tax=Peromyscus maniculatus bairdii TaxID=230844 RepID=UPI00077DBF9D|nr:methyl-CpG-binding domain protein 1 isoform X10 [Peromyscus maniculatus bairdii]
MAEDWQDCPALGPGWKRREAFRKSGASCGRSDIYYQSPTGEKIRSKVELTRYLGPACDLTLFNFRQGILCYPVPKTHPLPAPNKKKKKPSKPAKAKKRQVGPQKSEVRKETPRKGRKAGAGAAAGSGAAAGAAPASLPALGCCENCGIRLSRDCIKRQRLKALCKDCRAQRIAFNREQRMFRRVGCGECTACLVKEDCGACSICRLQLPHDVASELFCKCERRRCLRIVEKSRGCGVCRGCQTQEDCGRCRVCLRPARPGLKRQWRCLQRRCFWDKRDRRKSGSKVAARRHSRAQPLPPRPASQHPEPTELQPYTNHHRQNRKCGACAACLRRMDCGHCDFCCDKPKFGGSNQKRQKCRWRQCLQFAMKRLLPSTGPGSEEGAGLPPCRPCRKRPGSPRRRLRLSSPSKAPLAVLTTPPGPARASAKQQAGRGFVLPPPDTDFVFLQEGAASPVQVPGPAAASSEAPLQEAQSWGVAMPQVKQEKTDAPEEWTSGTGFPTSALQPGYPSKALDSDLPPVKQEPPGPAEDREENREDYVSESAPEEEAGGVGTPVITEIFSLGGTRLRDAAAWLPRLHKLLAVNENEYFTELQLKEEIL